MAEHDWVFVNQDGSKTFDTLPGEEPSCGDGKSYKGRAYEVIHKVASDRRSVIIAKEVNI